MLIAIKEKNREKAYENCRLCFYYEKNTSHCKKDFEVKCAMIKGRLYFLSFRLNTRRFWMIYKWVYDLNKKKLYKTKKELIKINNSEDDSLEISYSDKRVISRFYTLASVNAYRVNLYKALLFINDFDSTVTRIILRRKRFWKRMVVLAETEQTPP